MKVFYFFFKCNRGDFTKFMKDDPNLEGEDYRKLIEIVSKYCNRFAFVVPLYEHLDENKRLKEIDDFIEPIQWFLIERKKQDYWLPKESYVTYVWGNLVYYFELNYYTKEFLKEKSDSLRGWSYPLPEDLMFFKDDQCLIGIETQRKHIDFFVYENNLKKELIQNSLLAKDY